jgi:hypothetical protein
VDPGLTGMFNYGIQAAAPPAVRHRHKPLKEKT